MDGACADFDSTQGPNADCQHLTIEVSSALACNLGTITDRRNRIVRDVPIVRRIELVTIAWFSLPNRLVCFSDLSPFNHASRLQSNGGNCDYAHFGGNMATVNQ